MFFRRVVFGGLVAAFLAPAADGAETITNSIGMKLVLVPAGEFMMGASEDAATTLQRFPYAGES